MPGPGPGPGGDGSGLRDFVPEAEWYASLPVLTSSASALVTRPGDAVLIVRPSYREDRLWVLPGGVAEAGEPPRRCAEREVAEETGLSVTAGALLAVHWIPPSGAQNRPIVAFLFDGGSVPETGRVRPGAGEIDECAFLPVTEALPLLVPRSAQRLEAAWRARRDGRPVYLEGTG